MAVPPRGARFAVRRLTAPCTPARHGHEERLEAVVLLQRHSLELDEVADGIRSGRAALGRLG